MPTDSQPRPVVVDCDPGHDDALALLLASRHAHLLGVTTVSGNAPLDAVTRNALGVLAVAGVDVPVHRGASGPLLEPADGSPRHALHVHGASGLDGVTLPVASRTPAGSDAPGFLIETSRRHEGLWLVAIGPLTNVARAMERDPTLADRLAGIAVMGGSTAGGNVTAAAEFNIWADPEAADIVFRSGARIRLSGLNLTHQFKSGPDTLTRLAALDTTRARFAAALLEYLHGRMRELTGEAAAALHDPCAVLTVTHPELFEFETRPVAVELEGRWTRGMTVVDRRYRSTDGWPELSIAVRIDAGRAFERLYEALAVGD